jgi:hypothetical protein
MEPFTKLRATYHGKFFFLMFVLIKYNINSQVNLILTDALELFKMTLLVQSF